jgi:RHS repeat-associated protein
MRIKLIATLMVAQCNRSLLTMALLLVASHLATAQCVPATKTFSGGGTVCQGNSINLVLSGVDFEVEYFIKLNGVEVSGSRKTRMGGITSLSWAVSTSGTYDAWAQIEGCPLAYVMSGQASVVITQPGSLVVTPSANPAAICYGTTFTLTASGGSGYQWYSSVNMDYPTTQASISPDLPGTYWVTATVTCAGTVESTHLTLNFLNPINGGTIGGSGQTICPGSTAATLTNVTGAYGSTGTYNYQWRSRPPAGTWADIPGQTSATLTPVVNSTTEYLRRASTTGCGDYHDSNVITVTTYSTVTAGAISVSQTICSGSAPATLTNMTSPALGNGTYAYQWQSSIDNNNWSPISGATSSTYTPPTLTAQTYYRRTVTSCSITVNSPSVTISIFSTVTPGAIGSNQSICYNTAAATLTNQTSPSNGNNTYAYQWQSSPNGSSGWTDIAGATSSTYSPGTLTATTYYRRNVTSCSVTVTSGSVMVTVYPIFNPGVIGSAQSICYNTTPAALTSSSSASGGNGTITYQWQSSANGSSGWADIGGATATTYSPGLLTATTYYHRNATNTCGTVSSASVMITVYPIFNPGGIGSAQSICYNTAPAAFTSSSSASGGNGTITYQWQSSPNGSSGWADIAGATATTYSPGLLTATTYYHRNATNTCGTVSSSSVMITVYPIFNPGGIGSAQSICYNSAPAALTSSSSASGGNGTITYQWQSSPNGSSGWADIAGATATTYSPGLLMATTYYHRNATNTCGTVSSSSVMITVYPFFNPGGIGSNQSICYNTTPAALTSSSPASGGNGTITYQWQSSPNGTSGWADIAGATAITYSPGLLTATTYYQRNATNTCGPVSTSAVTVTVYAALSPGGIGNAQSICYNTTPATLTSSSSASGGNGTITYQWQSSANGTSGWADIAGATATTYSPGLLTATTYYHRNATNTCGTVSSSSVMITVYPVFTPGGIGSAQSICYNTAPAALTSSGSASGGNGTITYQWQSSPNGSSGWADIAGATAATYSPGLLTTTTYYHRNATNTCGTVSSSSVMITVYPFFNPGGVGSNQSICYNTTPAAFTSSSSASGGNGTITYQWQSSTDNLNWPSISGATSTTYTPPSPLTVTTYYRRNATNSCGTVGTPTITITVYPALNPGGIGSNQSICYNTAPAVLTSSSSASGGNGTFTYQWQSSPNGSSGWADIAGATATTYSPGLLTATTYYQRNATNTCGTVSTSSVAVTVYPVFNPGGVGSNQSICNGTTPAPLTSSSSASGGNGTITYQWQSSPNGSTGWADIGSATATTYSPGALTATTYYRRNASNSCAATTTTITITVYPAFNPGGIGSAQSICYNTTPTALTSSSSASGGNGTITYQWQSSPNGTSGWADIAGATATTYSPGLLTATTYYHRNATNTCGTVSSSSVMITVYPVFTPGGIGSAQSICYNTAPAALTSSGSASGGNGTITYQWQSSPTGSSGWVDIAGATATTYSPGLLTATTYYHRNAINTCGTLSSSSVMITVYPFFNPGGVGSNQSICYNTTPAALTSSSSASGGNGTITYQWQSSTDNLTWPSISGATSTTYTPPSPLTATTYYRRNATNTCGPVSTSTVTVTVYPAFSPGGIGTNQAICYNATPAALTSSSSASGGNGTITYQWQSSTDNLNWPNISGATSTTYTPPSPLTVTTYYRRNAINTCGGTLSSSTVTVTVYPALSPGGIGSDQTICYNTTPAALTSSSSASGGNGTITYQWQSSTDNVSWPNIPGATATTYTPPSPLTITTYYRRNATNTCGPVSTATVSVVVNSLPVITNNGSSTFVPGGSTVLNATAGKYSYQWVRDGSNIAGATASAFTATFAGSYQVKTRATVSSPECISASTVITVDFAAPIQDMNYIQTVSFNKVGVNSGTNLNTLVAKEFVFSTTYFDGLGRPLQTVALGGGGNGNDLIQINEYDAYGREAKKYLPYEHSSRDGRYQLNATPAQAQFYTTMADVAHDTKAYSNTDFEPSPLNRPLKDYAPGQSWANKPVEHKYLINQDGTGAGQEKIIAWTINALKAPVRLASLNCGYYPTGALTIKSTTDEDGHEVREYTDNSGRIILKKVYFTGTITDFSPGNWAETYYVYDESGLLRFVFQPELSKTFSAPCMTPPDPDNTNPDPTSLANFAFQYKYDSRRRMISKKVPGAEEVNMLYDDRDRLVLTQDGNLRAASKYLFTKYDALNRPIMTGIYSAGGLTFSQVSSSISHTNFAESTSTNVNDVHGYTTNLVFPTSGLDILTVTYYDNYSFRSKWETDTGKDFDPFDEDLSKDGYDFPNSMSTQITGLTTGTKAKVLDGGSSYLRTATYYDGRHRVVQTIAENYIGGTDRTSTLYDLAGKVLETKTKHVTTYSTHTILTAREFDGAGRSTATFHTTDGNNPVLLYANEYNSIGQLKAKSLHKEGTGSFAQRIDYGYNIRGWLTKINDGAISAIQSDGDYFGMELSYENPFSSLSATASYNGNISATKWAVLGKTDQAYAYEYDKMSRLKDATHFDWETTWVNNSGRFSESVLNYDLNGNIQDLRRKGYTTASYMDDLHYDYIGTGNQLRFVNDLSSNAEGFNNGTTDTSVDYDYDENGNLTQDLNKGIGANGISYNFLNLPQTIQKSPTEYLMYTYDATGRKLRQQVFGSTAKVTDYVNEFVYEDNVLRFFNHEDGRVVKPGTPEYQYHMKDHLGNVRLTFTTVPDEEEATATLETSSLPAEKAKFLRIDNARRIYSTLFDKTNGSSPGYSQRLNGTPDVEKYGVARSIAVMPGDVVRAEVYAKYVDTNTGNWTGAMTTLMSQIAQGAAGVVFEGGSYSSSTSSFLFTPVNTSGSTGGPKAYLNWLVFDLNYNPILAKSGYDRMSTVAKEYGQDVAHERLYSPDIVITEPGYVYIYLSNEEPTPVEVYFDDFKVTHEMGLLVQMNDYYPFGLTFNSIERDSPGNNRWKFQGQEHVDDLDLNWDSFKWRNHQPDIGRFFNIDPLAEKYYYNSTYSFAENKLGLGVELEGLELSRQRGIELEVAQANNQLPKNLSIRDRIELQGGSGAYALDKVEGKLGTPTLAVSGNVQAGATSVQIVRNFQGLNVTPLAAEVASFEYKLQPGNESFKTGGIFDGEKKTVTSMGIAAMGVFTEAGASITTSAAGDQTLEYSLDGSLGGFGASTTGTTFPDGSTSETFRKGFTFSFGGGEGVSGNFKVFLGFETTRSTEVQSSQVKIE